MMLRCWDPEGRLREDPASLCRVMRSVRQSRRDDEGGELGIWVSRERTHIISTVFSCPILCLRSCCRLNSAFMLTDTPECRDLKIKPSAIKKTVASPRVNADISVSVGVVCFYHFSGDETSAAAAADSGVAGVPGDVKQVGRGYLIASCLQRHFSLRGLLQSGCYQGATRLAINGLLYAGKEARKWGGGWRGPGWVKLPSGSNLGRVLG
ncbi:hypothetical protein GBF38_010855 [Nibea albiflora]|uniref:Uncharacterized protein n=1 Tax=Nibea albiflora TaxID=240163 RepID=A0ACB7ET16_NIBAL|nr:hypothetical protein GBF38_010855 [Nibea albiflora]